MDNSKDNENLDKFKKTTKKKYANNKVSKEEYFKEKEDKMNDFLKKRSDAIIASLNSTPENIPIWESPIFHNKYINPASNVRYNSGNSASLNSEIQMRLLDKDLNENQEVLPFFMTYKQAQNNGLQVKKGSKSYTITKRFGKKVGSYKSENEQGQEEQKDIYQSAITFDPVFNIGDLEGELSEKIKRNMAISFDKSSDKQTENVLSSLINSSPVKIKRVTDQSVSSSSYYVPSMDFINVPPSAMFKNILEEISTIAHEIAHSWGHESRLKRVSLKDYSKSKEARAEEEIVANVAAQAVIQHFGIETSLEQRQSAFSKNHDVYDFGWARNLKDKPDIILKAIDAADKTAGKIIEAVELDLSQKLKENPNLEIPEFVKERIIVREANLSSENSLEEPKKTTKRTYNKKPK